MGVGESEVDMAVAVAIAIAPCGTCDQFESRSYSYFKVLIKGQKYRALILVFEIVIRIFRPG